MWTFRKSPPCTPRSWSRGSIKPEAQNWILEQAQSLYLSVDILMSPSSCLCGRLRCRTPQHMYKLWLVVPSYCPGKMKNLLSITHLLLFVLHVSRGAHLCTKAFDDTMKRCSFVALWIATLPAWTDLGDLRENPALSNSLSSIQAREFCHINSMKTTSSLDDWLMRA